MNLEDRITIIHGPNGFGKTALLRLIAGFFSNANGALRSIPFTELEIDFDKSRRIKVLKVAKTKEGRVEPITESMQFHYFDGSRNHDFEIKVRHPEQIEIPLHAIDEVIPELERVEPRIWRHLPTGELLGFDEVVDRYSEEFPIKKTDEPPDWLMAVRQAVPIRFIQAERLQTSATSRRVRHTRVAPNRAVKKYSEELGAIVKQTLTEYAALSQSLDRTFPARVVTHSSPPSMEELQTALKDIEAKRARLVEAGLLGQESEEPTVQVLQHIDETKRAVLSVYVQDSYKKLSVFDQLVAKVELFRKSINERFLYKQLSVGKEGFGLTTAEGDELNPLSLSSGEQHEIVLLYELLFKATENSLILLDEPEISLHVAWLEQFLSDLHAITALSHFDVIITTHSPQIISDRWDLTVELKGPENAVLSQAAPHSK
jgi:predicted ATP-binding protein involved in virulence